MRPMLLALVAMLLPIMAAAQGGVIGSAPGQLIDVAGQKLHLLCTGSGSPTVVLESGASSFAIDFSLVQQGVAQTNRVCSYDRFGHGWSGQGDGRDSGVAETLHSALSAAGERPPYVMVGASRGGLYVRDFAHRFADDVVGLVLVDPTSEERLFTTYQGESVPIAFLTADQLRATMNPGPRIAIPRRAPQTGSPFDRLPPDLYRTRVALDERLIASFPDSVSFEIVANAAEEERAFLAGLWDLRSTNQHPLGDRPLIVLSRGLDTNLDRTAALDRLAQLSSNSRHILVAQAGHEIHLFQPEAVVQAILQVVNAAESGATLPLP
jgi:pimeloyl-ACP methyl ester carboxylesterase